jgi:general secretion pathway protein E
MNMQSPDPEAFEERLLAALSAKGAIGAESIERARRAFVRAGGSIVDIIIRLGLCEEKALARALAALAGLELYTQERLPERAVRAGKLSIPFLREARVLPLAEADDHVLLAGADPTDAGTSRALALAFGKPPRFLAATASDVEDGLTRLYSGAPAQGEAGTPLSVSSDVTDTDIARLRESASQAPIVRFVERLIARAVDARASDIHMEPLERRLRVRLRIDGILHDEEMAPLSSAPAIVSRIKILAKLDIGERRLPQDGSIKLNLRGREIDLRVATAPVGGGESIAIRILDRESVRLDLRELGFGEPVMKGLVKCLHRPNGIILVTGPTGSGKSTTLYAGLNLLNTSERKIITVEDPVEYKIEGLNQIQVKPEIGLDFARALRSILRHDPDVIMVGEIRDAETARIATQAALTGHLVLSTLHTNDAASAVTRLIDMGIEDYLLTPTVVGILAQRLVRSLCARCRRCAEVPAFLEPVAEKRRSEGRPVEFFVAAGCVACRGTGYRGRTVVAELMEISAAVKEAVLGRAEASRLRMIAVGSGMVTLHDAGLDAVFSGKTTHDEVLRVAQDVEMQHCC